MGKKGRQREKVEEGGDNGGSRGQENPVSLSHLETLSKLVKFHRRRSHTFKLPESE